MGSGWMIKTFDRAKWDMLFGSGSPEAEQKIVDTLLWENDGYFDDDAADLQVGPNREEILASQQGQQARHLARHLARTGFTYASLDATQAIALDEFGAGLGSPEALGDELDVKGHSPDFYPQSHATELFERTGNSRSWSSWIWLLGRRPPPLSIQYLPFLMTGRRFGTDAEPTQGYACYYIVFSPAEVMALSREVEMARDAAVPWRDKWGLSTTEECLLAPLGAAVKSGRWVLMTLAY
jgi:hypothetical protein